MLYVAGWCQLLSHTEDVDLTDSCHLWKTYWCGTDRRVSPVDRILVWHWQRYHLNIGVALTVITRRKKDWYGTGWQLSPIEKKIGVTRTDSYHLWENIGVALTDSYHLWEILVWHCDWLTVITYGKNIGVALTELLPMQNNIGVALTELLPVQKNIGVALTELLPMGKTLVWHWLLSLMEREKYWCGTDWQLSTMEKTLVWH